MGNLSYCLTYLEEPIKDKELNDGQGKNSNGSFLRYGTCEMQGWRVNMEDAHLAVPDFHEGIGLFGVFDGHGGRGVSRFAARELPAIIKETKGWAAGDYRSALEEAFLKVDERLIAEAGRAEVETLDRPDPAKPRRLLHVPKHLFDKFQQGRAEGALQDGEEQDVEVDLANFCEEGEEEELFEGDGEIDSADASLIQDESAPEEPTGTKSEASPRHEDAADSGENDSVATPSSVDDSRTKASTPPPGESDDDDNEAYVEIDPSEILRQPTPEAQGCTAVVVMVVNGGAEGPRLICANAGDSRAVLSRVGSAVALSEDHKPENAEETARIEKAGGFVKHMPGGARVQGDLNLSRAMGDLRYKQKKELPAAEQIVTAFPEVRIEPLQSDDEFIVIGCDGIWEKAENQDAVDYVRSRLLAQSGASDAASPPLSRICAEICDRGICTSMDGQDFDGKGCDNMTIMVVQLKPQIEGSPRKRAAPEAEEEPPAKQSKPADTPSENGGARGA